MLDMPLGQIRKCVREGFLTPSRGQRGEFLFSFQDLVLLRTAANLMSASIQPKRVRAALYKLKAQMPQERPLSGVHIAAQGDELLVHDREGEGVWNPESGQRVFDFEHKPQAQIEPFKAAAPALSLVEQRPQPSAEEEDEAQVEAQMSAEDWFDLGYELETCAPRQARDAYRRALELDPDNPEIRLNMGRLLFEAGELSAAERHYRIAAEGMSNQAEPAFNLGVVLEEMGQLESAIMAYRESIKREPTFSDGYARLLNVLEAVGRPEEAAQVRARFRQLRQT